MLWLVWSSIQTTQTFSIWAVRLFHFLIISVFTGVALLISFKNFSIALTTWLTVWCKRPCFQPVSAFNLPSSLSLTISSFWFKARDMQLFLSLRGIVRLLICFSITVVSQGIVRPKEQERLGGTAGWRSSHKFAILYGHGSRHPKTITIVMSKITHHRSP